VLSQNGHVQPNSPTSEWAEELPSGSSVLQGMSWILIVVGAMLTMIGLVMIPLPGPGSLLLFPGAVVLAAVVAVRMSKRLSQR
jgi:uncharacterized membrane protein